jgi:predicted CXXCH cytochrome family protein
MKRICLAAALVALAAGASTLQAQAPDGAALYTRACTSCHGAAGVPNPAMVRSLGAIPDLSDPAFQRTLADSTISNVIANGKGTKMRAPRTPYTPEQLRALVAHVRSLRRAS